MFKKNSDNGFQCHEQLSPIYFDHKIADGASTFQKFLVFGTFPVKKNEECQYTQIINQCNNSEKGFKNTLCTYFIDKIESVYCPLTFYKTITYSYNQLIYNPSEYKLMTLVELGNSETLHYKKDYDNDENNENDENKDNEENDKDENETIKAEIKYEEFDDDLYVNKYIKYKKKYLNLKKN